ncbi:MAG: DUF6526 family protein [Acidobacteriota bacterium]
MSRPEQNAANHAKYVPAYHFVALPILLIHLLWSAVDVFRSFGADAALSTTAALRQLAVAIALAIVATYVRLKPLKVQDRLIRLEEQMRLDRVLSPALRERASALRLSHLIALRFAPDDELEELVTRVLDGELDNAKAIKQAIRNWRADHVRC